MQAGEMGRPALTPSPAEIPLERERELAELSAAVTAAMSGSGRIVLVEGAPGLGKTLLLSLAAREAQERGVTVLRARGGELERQFPFGVALQLFEPVLSSASAAERRRILAGAAAHAAPVLAGASVETRTGEPDFAVLHGLHWVAANLAEERPLLLAIDDAHAADEASLRALLYMAQRIEDLPLALLLTTRPAAASAAGGALTALATHPLVRRLELDPLSEPAIATIVRERLPRADDAFCAACARATGGNPFFARELLTEASTAAIPPTAEHAARVGEMGPATIALAVGARLERLAKGAVPLAQAVAVLGDAAALPEAAALAGLPQAQARAAADELTGADVLRPAPALSFVHPIVRQAVYLGIPAAERAQLHLDAARLLGPEGAEHAAPHLLRTAPSGDGEHGWIVECLHAAARRALSGGSPEIAAHYLERALEEPMPAATRARLLVDLGRAEARAGRATAIERLRAAVALLEQPQERARALAQLGHALYAAGDNAGAAGAFDEGLQILGGADPALEEELTAGYIGAARLDFRTREEALARFEALLSGSAEATTRAQRELLAHRALEHALLGNVPAEEVLALVRRALGDGQLLREVGADGVAHAVAVATLLIVDALDELEEATTAGLEDARRRGSVVAFAGMSTARGAARYLRGDLTGALADLQGGLEPVPVMLLAQPYARGWIALAHLDRGEHEETRRTLGPLPAEDDGPSQYPTYNWILFARGRLAHTTGDPVEGLEHLLACGRRQLAIPAPNPALLSWRAEAAIAAFKVGQVEQAHELADEELRLARAFGSPRALGNALRAAGLVRGGGGGIELLEEAVAVLERSACRLEHARALIDLGAALRRGGRQADARETLRVGLDAVYHCRANGLAEFARAELVAAGARPRRPAMRGADALTPSELRVSELAERGLTNREIAQALFVSTKTVEFHLRNAYLKLRISSRRELSGALHGRTDATMEFPVVERPARQARP
jgi:DNA-binding CsgD family transcriptional regulator